VKSVTNFSYLRYEIMIQKYYSLKKKHTSTFTIVKTKGSKIFTQLKAFLFFNTVKSEGSIMS